MKKNKKRIRMAKKKLKQDVSVFHHFPKYAEIFRERVNNLNMDDLEINNEKVEKSKKTEQIITVNHLNIAEKELVLDNGYVSGWNLFNVGDCVGLYTADKENCYINGIKFLKRPGSMIPRLDHLEDVLEIFYFSCMQNNINLCFTELDSIVIGDILMKKGFSCFGTRKGYYKKHLKDKKFCIICRQPRQKNDMTKPKMIISKCKKCLNS